MSINRFLTSPDEKPFHSNDYARVAHGGKIGAVSPQSFGSRLSTDRDRRLVQRYQDSLVIRQRYAAGLRSDAGRAVTGWTAPPTAGQPAGSLPPRARFHEPPGRTYNPYQ